MCVSKIYRLYDWGKNDCVLKQPVFIRQLTCEILYSWFDFADILRDCLFSLNIYIRQSLQQCVFTFTLKIKLHIFDGGIINVNTKQFLMHIIYKDVIYYYLKKNNRTLWSVEIKTKK